MRRPWGGRLCSDGWRQRELRERGISVKGLDRSPGDGAQQQTIAAIRVRRERDACGGGSGGWGGRGGRGSCAARGCGERDRRPVRRCRVARGGRLGRGCRRGRRGGWRFRGGFRPRRCGCRERPSLGAAVEQRVVAAGGGFGDAAGEAGFVAAGLGADGAAGGDGGDLEAGAGAEAGGGGGKRGAHEARWRRTMGASCQACSGEPLRTMPSNWARSSAVHSGAPSSAGRARSIWAPGSSWARAKVSALERPVPLRRRARASGVSLSATSSLMRSGIRVVWAQGGL